MAEKLVQVKITYKCFIAGKPKKPGDVVEVPENIGKYLVSANRAAEDLKWEPTKAQPKK